MMKLLDIAGGYVGETEIHGAQDNPKIVAMFKKSGAAWVDDDETPWCAAFVGAVLNDAGIKGTNKLNARSYLDWGVVVDQPQSGDVVVFWRGNREGWQGHVAFYVRTDPNGDIVVLGGNQGDAVSVKPYSKSRLLGYRRPINAQRAAIPVTTKGTALALAAGSGISGLALWWNDILSWFGGWNL